MNQTTTAPVTTETSLTVSRLIKAPREKVYAAFTDPTELARWYHPGDMTTTVDSFEAKAGSTFRLTMHNGPNDEPGDHTAHGKILEVIPNERIVKSWNWEREDEALPGDSRVTIELSDADGGTMVKLVHEMLPNKESVDAHADGWQGCLINLEAEF